MVRQYCFRQPVFILGQVELHNLVVLDLSSVGLLCYCLMLELVLVQSCEVKSKLDYGVLFGVALQT